MRKFKTGDRVRLNSGTLIMTVRNYDPKNKELVICDYEEDVTPKQNSFHEDQLNPVDDDDFNQGSIFIG